MNVYPWQRTEWQHLCNAFLNEKLPHAVILNGQAGLGKFQFAKEFAKFIMCSDSNKFTTLKSCNQCKQCNLINKDSNPDLYIIGLEDSNVIKLEQIKNFISQTNSTAQYNGFKIAIIYPAEKMNINAANALLKNLEEPVGAKTIFLLVSHQCMQLSATIRSRCQRINFSVPNSVETKQWLVEQAISINEEEFHCAHELAQGAPLAIYQYLTDPTTVNTKIIMEKLQQAIKQPGMLFSELSKAFSKFSASEFIYCLQLVTSRLIKDEAKIDKENLYYLNDKLMQTKKALDTGIQLNAQLVIEDYLVKLKNIGVI